MSIESAIEKATLAFRQHPWQLHLTYTVPNTPTNRISGLLASDILKPFKTLVNAQITSLCVVVPEQTDTEGEIKPTHIHALILSGRAYLPDHLPQLQDYLWQNPQQANGLKNLNAVTLKVIDTADYYRHVTNYLAQNLVINNGTVTKFKDNLLLANRFKNPHIHAHKDHLITLIGGESHVNWQQLPA